MTTLNLVTKNKQEEIIKSYLEKVANETLTEKINNGVKIEKDGKTAERAGCDAPRVATSNGETAETLKT